MTCHEAQTKLSLYLYGELDFAQEEQLEQHLTECPFCERALAREKAWHTTANSKDTDVPLDFLTQCRQDLKTELSRSDGHRSSHAPRVSRWAEWFGFSATRWSMQIATASFLVFAGFAAARWMDRNGLPGGVQGWGLSESGLINPSAVRIRDIQPEGSRDRVRIVVDQIRQREITGRIDDQSVRQLLFSAMKDSDPALRVDSVEILDGQNGQDVRDALISRVQHDPNAAVRVRALQGLRPFIADAATREALKSVLEQDENPEVRSEAIEVLASLKGKALFSPDLAGALQDIMRSERDDDYVRMRCFQLLREMSTSPDVY